MRTRIKKWNPTILKSTKNKLLLSGILAVFGVTWYISAFHYQLMLLLGSSMEPTYHNGQFLILDKHSGNYDHGDIIAFTKESINGYLVKRIIAVPGDNVLISGGILYINGHPQDKCRPITFAGIAEELIFLEEGDYFVLGDNLTESKDSRYEEIGLVNETEIKGKVLR